MAEGHEPTEPVRSPRLERVVRVGARIGKIKLKTRLKRAVHGAGDDEDPRLAVIETVRTRR